MPGAPSRRGRGPRLLAVSAVAMATGLTMAPRPVAAFAVYGGFGLDAESSARRAPRWDAEPYLGTGLHDGLQVAIDPSVAATLATVPEDVPILEQAIADAFAMWENAALRIVIEYDSPVARRGVDVGAEIDVFVVPGSDDVFLDNAYYGATDIAWEVVPDRLLTNGQRVWGDVITGADVFLNGTRLLDTQREYGLPTILAAFALTRLLAHEIGHGLGLEHPNEQPSFDYDLDPLDVEVVDQSQPIAGLATSPVYDERAIMSNQPCGVAATPCAALFFQSLRPDDRLGRDVLYGVPEPRAALADAAGLCALGAAGLATSARRGRSRGCRGR